ncbi:type II DNA modification enzyme [Staphylococcus saccharolyticus]|uniref:Type II DNA modification enzyme n=1 Tax=Staphylococcus saccharolyticus TaxID=33028 RepID=A0A380H0Z5_9STAP|nr:type II DNA modification enzyme [Staphylococcus saccharolyticus]
MKKRGKIEKLWRKEKYRVLLHDQNAYKDIRQTLKENTSLLAIQSKIDKAITVPPT